MLGPAARGKPKSQTHRLATISLDLVVLRLCQHVIVYRWFTDGLLSLTVIGSRSTDNSSSHNFDLFGGELDLSFLFFPFFVFLFVFPFFCLPFYVSLFLSFFSFFPFFVFLFIFPFFCLSFRFSLFLASFLFLPLYVSFFCLLLIFPFFVFLFLFSFFCLPLSSFLCFPPFLFLFMFPSFSLPFYFSLFLSFFLFFPFFASLFIFPFSFSQARLFASWKGLSGEGEREKGAGLLAGRFPGKQILETARKGTTMSRYICLMVVALLAIAGIVVGQQETPSPSGDCQMKNIGDGVCDEVTNNREEVSVGRNRHTRQQQLCVYSCNSGFAPRPRGEFFRCCCRSSTIFTLCCATIIVRSMIRTTHLPINGMPRSSPNPSTVHSTVESMVSSLSSTPLSPRFVIQANPSYRTPIIIQVIHPPSKFFV